MNEESNQVILHGNEIENAKFVILWDRNTSRGMLMLILYLQLFLKSIVITTVIEIDTYLMTFSNNKCVFAVETFQK